MMHPTAAIGVRPIRQLLPVIGTVGGSAVILLAAAFSLAAAFGVPLSLLTRDPATASETGFFVGILSNLGVLLWSSAASIALFGYLVRRQDSSELELSRFLLYGGLVTAMLSLDDFFLLHEEVFPLFGIPEKVVYGVYGLLTLIYLVRFRSLILERTDAVLFALALGLLGVSVALDVAPFPIFARVILEDSLKFIGIAYWLAYFARTSYQAIKNDIAALAMTAVIRSSGNYPQPAE